MEVVISGSTGLLGTALAHSLRADGHRVLRLVRREPPFPDLAIRWDPEAGMIDADRLEGVDAVVNLSGHSIGARRWSPAEKQRIRDSRIGSTSLLARTLAGLERPPPVMLSASAIGWYGDRGDEELTESSDPGVGFLAGLCRDWEEATLPAQEAGVRVAELRTGLVLSPKGGFLDRPLKLFKAGLGGRIGSGRQWWSWIHIDDHVAAMRFLIESDLEGPVNLTGPSPVTNAELTRTLGAVLHRPTLLPAPRLGVRLLLGRELADEVVLTGQRVLPAALTRAGFSFSRPELEPALRACVEG